MRYYLVVQAITHPVTNHSCFVLCFDDDGKPLFLDEEKARTRLVELQTRYPQLSYELRKYDQ